MYNVHVHVYINFFSVVHVCALAFPGVDTKFKGAFYEVLLSVSHVPELSRVQEEEEGGLVVGAAVTLNTLTHHLTSAVDRFPGYYILP